MKATKTELIRLARLAQKDIASGRASKNAQQAVEVLSDYQNSSIELLDLTLEEATKEQSNKSLVDSFGFLFGQSLEALRFDIESGYRTASELAESVRKRLVTVSKTKACDPFTLLFLVQCFGAAKLILAKICVVLSSTCSKRLARRALTIPILLNSLMCLALSPISRNKPTATRSCSIRSWRRVRKGCRVSTAPSWPRHSCSPARQLPLRLSVGWLLDPAPSVRQALATALRDAARKGNVTPTMLRRMIAMRNWLPGDSRAALDTAIATARRKGVPPAQWDEIEVRDSRAPASMALARLVFSRIVGTSERMCLAASC